MQKRMMNVLVLGAMITILFQGCATVSTGPLRGNRHTIEVTGFLVSSIELYQKFEEKAVEICGDHFDVVHQDFETDDVDTILVGVIECQ